MGRLANWLGRTRSGLQYMTLVPLSAVVPRRNDFWLFGHRDGVFGGNSRGLFLWLSIHRPDIRAVWIGDSDQVIRTLRENGFEAVRRRSAAGLLATLRARVFVFCHGLPDVSSRLSGGAFLANLWHGVGIKATMFGDHTGPMAKFHRKWSGTALGRMMYYEHLKRPDILASTSDFMQDHFARQFAMSPERCPQLGYPRLDPLADPALKTLSDRIDRSAGFTFNPDRRAKVTVYAPTWRDTGRPFLQAALPDLRRLSDALRKTDAVLYVKTHPWSSDKLPTTFDNILVWPAAIDVFAYLDDIDAFVTDYSSLYYDYIFRKTAGAVLYTFDIAEYEATDRQILYPFRDNTAGLTVSTFVALCDAVASGEVYADRDDARAAIERLRAKFWGGSGPVASSDIVAFIEDRTRSRRTTRTRTRRAARTLHAA